MTYESHADFAAVAWPRLVRAAHMLTGDFHEAEDLVQTALAKVYARWRKIPRADVDVYIRRALVNNNISRMRKKRIAHLLMPFLPEAVHRTHGGHAEAVERSTVLVQALPALTARQRAVMVLRYWEDMSEQEIATALNCSVGTVKTHARRGWRPCAPIPYSPAIQSTRKRGADAPAPPAASVRGRATVRRLR